MKTKDAVPAFCLGCVDRSKCTNVGDASACLNLDAYQREQKISPSSVRDREPGGMDAQIIDHQLAADEHAHVSLTDEQVAKFGVGQWDRLTEYVLQHHAWEGAHFDGWSISDVCSQVISLLKRMHEHTVDQASALEDLKSFLGKHFAEMVQPGDAIVDSAIQLLRQYAATLDPEAGEWVNIPPLEVVPDGGAGTFLQAVDPGRRYRVVSTYRAPYDVALGAQRVPLGARLLLVEEQKGEAPMASEADVDEQRLADLLGQHFADEIRVKEGEGPVACAIRILEGIAHRRGSSADGD